MYEPKKSFCIFVGLLFFSKLYNLYNIKDHGKRKCKSEDE